MIHWLYPPIVVCGKCGAIVTLNQEGKWNANRATYNHGKNGCELSETTLVALPLKSRRKIIKDIKK